MTTWKTWDADGYNAEIEADLQRRGFVDSSYGNDVCPSFENEALQLRVWIDFADAQRREDDSHRFALSMEGGEIGSAEAWEDFLPMLDNRAPTLASGFTYHDYEEFAERNYARYTEAHCGEGPEDAQQAVLDGTLDSVGIVELLTDDYCIVHPWLSECGRFKVDPVRNWGDLAFQQWKHAAAKHMAAGK